MEEIFNSITVKKPKENVDNWFIVANSYGSVSFMNMQSLEPTINTMGENLTCRELGTSLFWIIYNRDSLLKIGEHSYLIGVAVILDIDAATYDKANPLTLENAGQAIEVFTKSIVELHLNGQKQMAIMLD